LGFGRWTLRVLAIIADGLYRTTSEGFFASGDFFRGFWLLVDEGITVLVRSSKAVGGCIATNIAVDTRRVYIVDAGNILFNFVVLIWQNVGLGS
jgi:hypothetical protein